MQDFKKWFSKRLIDAIKSVNVRYHTEYSVLGLTYPGIQVRVTACLLLLALRLYGALGGTFSTISSASATTVAASLLAAHWYIPRSCSWIFSIVKFPPVMITRSSCRGDPSFFFVERERKARLFYFNSICNLKILLLTFENVLCTTRWSVDARRRRLGRRKEFPSSRPVSACTNFAASPWTPAVFELSVKKFLQINTLRRKYLSRITQVRDKIEKKSVFAFVRGEKSLARIEEQKTS